MTRRLIGIALLAIAVALVGCGSNKNESKSSGAAAATTATATVDSDSDADSAKTKCKAPATSKPTGLPPAFPVPGELTVTKVQKDGPTVVIDGYWTSELDEAYTEFKDQVTQAGYTVLFTENEHRDAEISYKGSNRTGQIALRADCTEDGTTRVHITNRPA
jgi:hypothetical protein